MFVYMYISFFFLTPSNGFSKQLFFPIGLFIARCSFHFFSHRTNALVQSFSFQQDCLFVRRSFITFIFEFYLSHPRLRSYIKISYRAMASGYRLFFPIGLFIALCSFQFSLRTYALVQIYSFLPNCLFVWYSLHTFILGFCLRHLKLCSYI